MKTHSHPLLRKSILFWAILIFVLYCVFFFVTRASAQLAPQKDIVVGHSWQKPSPSIVAKGTLPVSDPVAAPRALPDLSEPLGDVARRNRTTHPQEFDLNDVKLVCPDGLTPGNICRVENKIVPKPQASPEVK